MLNRLKTAVKRYIPSLRGGNAKPAPAKADAAIQKLDCFAFARNDKRGFSLISKLADVRRARDKLTHLHGSQCSLPARALTKIKKVGFTLVELSIVLVIIGLLIGGILVGQSLIDSARVNRLVSDLKQYEIATVQFHNKFKKYPGDSPYFTPPGTGNNKLLRGTGGGVNPATGDGSGNCAAAPNATLSNNEGLQFWAHLSQSQMLKTNYPAYSDAGNCTGTHSAEDAFAGKITPYTKVDPQANENTNGYSSDRFSIFVRKGYASSNLYFGFVTLPLDTLALENKLGSQNLISETQIGLVNDSGIGSCYDVYGSGPMNCSDPTAANGDLRYYLAPP